MTEMSRDKRGISRNCREMLRNRVGDFEKQRGSVKKHLEMSGKRS